MDVIAPLVCRLSVSQVDTVHECHPCGYSVTSCSGGGDESTPSPSLFTTSRFFDGPQKLPPRRSGKKFSIILDLDETMINARTGEIIVRPSLRRFLEDVNYHMNQVEIIVWSAGACTHVKRCIDVIDPTETLIDYVIYRSEAWYTPPSLFDECKCVLIAAGVPLKDLDTLSHNRGKTAIIFDDAPYATVHNGSRAILVEPFVPTCLSDPKSLSDSCFLFILNIVGYIVNMTEFDSSLDSSSTSATTPTETKTAVDKTLLTIAAVNTFVSSSSSSSKDPSIGVFMSDGGSPPVSLSSEFNANESSWLAKVIRAHPFLIVKEYTTSHGIQIRTLTLEVSNVYSLIGRVKEFHTKFDPCFTIKDSENIECVFNKPPCYFDFYDRDIDVF